MKKFFEMIRDKLNPPSDLEKEKIRIIQNTHLFDHISKTSVRAVAQAAREVAYKASELIIKEGDPGDNFYIIKEGAARVFTNNETGQEIVIARLEQGAYFGEQALLEECPGRRNASVKAISNLSLLEISHQEITDILKLNTELKKTLRAMGKKQLVEKIFSQLELFRHINREALLSAENKILEFQNQQIIFSKGDPADNAYFIIYGQIDLHFSGDKEAQIITLGPNQIFGKLGLLHKVRRATAIARGRAQVLAIKGDLFSNIYENTPRLRAFIGAMQEHYEIPERGQITLYQGIFLNMPTINANFKLTDGREVVTSRVMGQNIFTISTLNVTNIEKIYIEKVDVIREILLSNNKMVGAVNYGAWEDLGYLCELVLDNKPVTENQINQFRKTGRLNRPSEDENKELVCPCMRVKQDTIEESIRAGITSLDDITLKTGAGSICGGCRPDILRMLGRYAWRPVYIDKIINISSLVRCYQLKPYDSRTQMYSYVPGQYAIISALIDQNWVERPYTLTSISGRSNYYEITVVHDSSGYLSGWLFANDTSKPLLRLSEPQGNFMFDLGVSIPAVFFAEEGGIIPALAFVRTLVAYKSRRRLYVDYSVNNFSDFVFTEEFLANAQQHTNLTIRTRVTDIEGMVTISEITQVLQNFPKAEFFICGSKTFTREISAILNTFQIPEDNIKIEEFTVSGEHLPLH